MDNENRPIIRFYTDTHIAKAVSVQLKNRGVDIIRCEEVNMALVSDFEHLAYASEQHRAIVTNDQGFTAHHRKWLEQNKHHGGIFLITKEKDDIGMIITNLLFWHNAIINGAAILETDVYDQLIFLP